MIDPHGLYGIEYISSEWKCDKHFLIGLVFWEEYHNNLDKMWSYSLAGRISSIYNLMIKDNYIKK